MKTTHKIIKEARDIIGDGTNDDYILKPTEHYKMFQNKAPEFAAIFRTSEIEAVAKKYEKHDGKANHAQKVFKTFSKRARWSFFFSVCFSTVLILVAAIFGQEEDSSIANILFVVFTAFAIVSGILANTFLSLIKRKNLFEKWMVSRSTAEMQRLEYFVLMVKSQALVVAVEDAVFNTLLRLEFFRRFQLDMQINFYGNRGNDHQKAADKAISRSAWLLGATSFTAALAGYLGTSINPKWGIIAAIGLILQAIVTMVLNRESVNQDQRNGERYARTMEALDEIRVRIDEVRQSIAAGNKDVLMPFVQIVNEQLSQEHRQWVDDMANVSKAMEELEKQLKKQQEKTKATIPNPPEE